MSFHKELFRNNWAGVNSRSNRAKHQQANRHEKRKNLYQEARNVRISPLNPKFDNFQHKATASSTPKPTKNSHLRKKNIAKENHNTNVHAVGENHLEKAEQKFARHEAHKQRFIAWKQEKMKLKELEKQQQTKPPFIPAGKAKGIQTADQIISFAPKDHIFNPPAGLRNPAVEQAERTSIYLTVPTPPKQKPCKDPMPLKSLEFNFNAKITRNLLKTKQKELPVTTENASNLASGNHIITKDATDNIFNEVQDNQPLTCSSPSEQPETTSNNKVPVSNVDAGNPVALLLTKRKPVVVSVKKIKPRTAATETRNSKKASSQKTTVSRPVNNDIKNTKSTGAVGKAKAMHQRKQTEMAPPAKENKRDYLKPKLATNLKAKKPIGGLKSIPNVDKKLTKCLQELGENIAPTETLACAGKSDKIINFVTSTQIKTSSSEISNTKFSDVQKTISPINPMQAAASKTKPKQNLSAKRVLLLEETKEKKGTKPRKFNFLKQIELDATVVESPVIMSIEKDTAIHNLSKIKNTNEKDLQSQPTENLGNKIASRILQHLQLQVNAKATKPQSPLRPKLTPRRSLKLQSSQHPDKSARNKKFNFLVQTELDETAVESVDSKEKKSDEVEENPTAPVISENLLQQPETPKKLPSSSERPVNYLSPFVSVSRGKVSARKEREKRNSIYLQITPTNSATAVKTQDTPVEKRRALEAVRYFRQQLQDEIERLHALCDQWDAYKEEKLEFLQANSGEDMINVTIGQTRLLTSKKFMQFNGLINRCEAHANGNAPINDGSEATKTITPVDLEGFWSMLGLQVENIGKRFQNLQRWKENDWEDPDAVKLKPRIRTNLTKVDRAKITMTSLNGISKPRVNTALRAMMRKKMAELRAKNESESCNTDQTQEVQVYTEEHTPNFSPRRSRRSTHSNSSSRRNSHSATSKRIHIVVPDRRSRSLARTIISVPSPVRSSPLKLISPMTSLQRNLHKQKPQKALPTIQIDPINSPPRTPIAMIQMGHKSILKTPGTAKSQSRNVVFNDNLSVKKFRPLKFDGDHQGTEYDAVQQVHMDDFIKMKSAVDLSPTHSEDERVYRLRNRRVKLRPSSEIELPK